MRLKVAHWVIINLFLSASALPLPPGTLTTMAGGGLGNGLPAFEASLYQPTSVFVDQDGNLFIADIGHNHIRRVDAKTGLITSVAGGVVVDGALIILDGIPGVEASLDEPFDVYVDQAGNIFIADTGNARIRKVDVKTGLISTLAGNGTFDYVGDGGPAKEAILNLPFALFGDVLGNIFFADSQNQRIRKIEAKTGVITTVAGNGERGFNGDNIPATKASLDNPNDIFIDAQGNLFISDTGNARIRKIEAKTGFITTVAGNGFEGFSGDGGLATQAKLRAPVGIYVDVQGNIFIADSGNHRIRKVEAKTGIISTVAGSGLFGFNADGRPANQTAFWTPLGVYGDLNGNLYIADIGNRRVRKVNAKTGIVTTVAGNGERWFIGDGHLADIVSLWEPLGICLDKDGNLFIADSCNEIVRKVDARTKIVSTVAGSGSQGFSGDNRLATSAELRTPSGVYVDSSGNIFIADSRNSRVRKVDSKTGIITTIAGNGQIGYSGDGGSAKSAALNLPYSIFVDSPGHVFIADIYNHRIRRVDAKTGIISTVAGNGLKEYSGDGKAATSAGLDGPFGIFVTPSGDLYIADTGNSRIRKVDAKTGIISTVAGNDERGFSGDGKHALQTSLNGPKGVFVDDFGNIFIADTGNMRLRKVDARTGIISTIAGNGKKGFGGNSGKATEMNLNTPWSVFGDASGNIYFCEKGFYLIRHLQGDVAVGIQPGSQLSLTTWGQAKAELFQNFPNPANPETWLPYRLLEPADITISIYNSKGDLVRRLKLGQKLAGDFLTKSEAVYWDGRNEAGEKVASGLYFYQIQAGRFVEMRRLVVSK